MAGDNRLFQEALKRGSAHAWNEQWAEAAEEYRRALAEFPEDVSARTYLAMALYKSGANREALDLYQALWESQPANVTMLQRVAELQEAVGDKAAAALSFGRLADAYARKRAHKEAFKAWHKVVQLSPSNPVLWNSLIQMALQVGTVKEVLPGYLDLARDLAIQSKFQDAIQIAERARTLDPENPLVAPMLAAIRKGIEYSLRAASFGEEVYPEDLAIYIPTVATLRSRVLGEVDSTPPPEPAHAWPDMPPRPDLVQTPTTELEIEALAPDQAAPTGADSAIPSPPRAIPEAPAAEPEPRVPAEPESVSTPPDVEVPRAEFEATPVFEEASELAAVAEPARELPTAEEFAEAEPQAWTTPEEEPTHEAPDEVEPVGEEPAAEQLVAGPYVEGAGPGEEAIPEPEAEEEEAVLEGQAAETAPSEPENEPFPAPEAEGELSPAAEPEEGEIRSWQDLMRRVEAAKEAGRLQEAISLYELAIATSGAVTQYLVELAELHEQLGQQEDAARVFGEALALTPDLPRALLGLSRLDLSARKLDSAESLARRALEASVPDHPEAEAQAVGLLLDILRERAAYGDLGGVAEGLARLRPLVVLDRLSPSTAERAMAMPRELLGQCVADHLEEISSLPRPYREEMVSALVRTEKLINEGKLRSAADEVYQIVSSHPDFLPAQSVLGTILVAQGRPREAIERANRLVDAYRLRGEEDRALEVQRWASEIESIVERNEREAASPPRIADGIVDAYTDEPEDTSEVTIANVSANGVEESSVATAKDLLLELAESEFAAGNPHGAAGLVRSALEDDRISADPATRAALLRVLQMTSDSDDGIHEALVEVLRTLGLPQDLADR